MTVYVAVEFLGNSQAADGAVVLGVWSKYERAVKDLNSGSFPPDSTSLGVQIYEHELR